MDVVRLDVDGAELDVLRSMTRSLRRLRPRVIALEVNTAMEMAGTSESQIHEFLAGLGYSYERTVIERSL